MFKVPEERRITMANLPHPRCVRMASRPFEGRRGAFLVPGPCAKPLWCIASDGVDWQLAGLQGVPWEHVSVSVWEQNRCPNWPEMNHVKSLFWDEEDCVVQFHPPRSDYVNCHAFVLHLWRPVGIELPRPDSLAVGPKGVQLTMARDEGVAIWP